ATTSETRSPAATRMNRSRPAESVPNQVWMDGAVCAAEKSVTRSSTPANAGTSTAYATMTRSTVSPATNRWVADIGGMLSRRVLRPGPAAVVQVSSAIGTHPRVERGIAHVGQERSQEHGYGREQGQPAQQGKVHLHVRGDDCLGNPGPGEDLLDDHGACHQLPTRLPATVANGSSAVGSAWRSSTVHSPIPRARAPRT